MVLDSSRPWFGLLSKALDSVATKSLSTPSLKTLLARGWHAERTLFYVPPKREGYDSDIAVVARTIDAGANRPVVWLLSTIGLSAVEQPRRGDAQVFRHVELVLISNNSEREDPFPARLGVALAQEPKSLPGWDWAQVAPPPLLDWMTIVGEELGAAMRSGTSFAICDTLTLGLGNSPWTRSKLDHSVLLPAPPAMLTAGMAPFDSPATPQGVVNPASWHSDSGSDRFSYGFQWLLPVSQVEYSTASRAGTWNMFADLVESAHRMTSDDDFSVAFDLLR
jgi:hypothetical protein